MNALTDTLLKRRQELKLSLRKAAELIGISHSYLSNLEKGIDPRTNAPINPTPEILRLISKAYNLNYDELMYFAGYLNPSDEVNKYNDKMYSEEIKSQVKEFIKKYNGDNKAITRELNAKIEEFKQNNLNLSDDLLIDLFVENTFFPDDLQKNLDMLISLGYDNKIIAKDGRKLFIHLKEDLKPKVKYSEVHDVEKAMEIILSQPGLMLKGELLSDESKIILANAIQMGLRTAEEIEKNKSKGDKNE